MTKEIERAEHHLDECNDMECKFNITGNLLLRFKRSYWMLQRR